MADIYLMRKNPNDETSAKNYSIDEMLAASQVNAAKRPNRFFAKKLAESGLI